MRTVKGVDADESADLEWQYLIQWADKVGVILPSDIPAPSPIFGATGNEEVPLVKGREHEILFIEEQERLYKFTFPNLAGFTVELDGNLQPYMLNASPLEYLARLRFSNRLFFDDVDIVGLWNCKGNDWRIVTSQKIVEGRHPEEDEISRSMEAMEFKELPWRGIGYTGCLGYYRRGYEVWDVHRKNFVRSTEGVVLPIDLIVTKLGIKKLHALP